MSENNFLELNRAAVESVVNSVLNTVERLPESSTKSGLMVTVWESLTTLLEHCVDIAEDSGLCTCANCESGKGECTANFCRECLNELDSAGECYNCY